MFVREERDSMKIGSNHGVANQQYQINQSKKNQEAQKKTMQQLSSGKKVNSAADDAATLAISKEMMKQIKALNQGSQNINSGIQVSNIADGAMSSISENLMDVEANSIRAMNGTMSDSDKEILQESIQGSLDTIDSIANSAQYNGRKLVDGSTDNISIETGGGKMSVTGSNMTTAGLGLQNFNITGSDANTDAIDEALSKLSGSRSKQGAQANALASADRSNQQTAENTTASYSRMMDTDMAEASSQAKQSSTVNAVQNEMMKKQMERNAMVTNLF